MRNNSCYTLIALTATILLSSCLKEKLADRAITSEFSKTQSDINLQVNGMYADMVGFNCFKNAMIYPLIMGADNFSGTAADAANFSQKLFTPQYRFFEEPWKTFYRVINHANTLLPLVETAPVDETFRDKITGNLLFLRAFSYFNLVRMFGGVPIHLDPITSQSDFYLKRNTRDEVYAVIFGDLEKAAPLLPLAGQLPASEFGNATRGAAQSILALAYLTHGNHKDLTGDQAGAMTSYTKARDMADNVILSNQYVLISNYADLWDIEKEAAAYTEVIFGIPYKRDAGASLSVAMGSEIGNWTRAGSGQWRIQPWFYEQCSTGDYVDDYRTEASFLTRFINSANGRMTTTFPAIPDVGDVRVGQPFLGKYVDPEPRDARNHENDFFIIRMAEVYLIKAEAENEINGPNEAGVTAFNKLRERARKADGTVRATPADILLDTLTQESFRQRIFIERGFELVGEGQRWFDLVRMQSPTGTTMYEYQYDVVIPRFVQGLPAFNANTQVWSNPRVAPNTAVPYQLRYLLFPIPASELAINTNMDQNPEW